MADFKKRKSGLFRKHFFITISIILASFVFLGSALLIMVSKLWLDEKREVMVEIAVLIAQDTSNVLQSKFMSTDGIGSIQFICNSLSQHSRSMEADAFITTVNGDIVFCKEMIQPNMALNTGNCDVHKNHAIPKRIVDKAVSSVFVENGDLDGSLESLNFIVAAPVKANGETIAIVFITRPIAEDLAPYIMGIFRMFFNAALIALLISFALVYIYAYRLTKPLRQMSVAAKQYAMGDFSARIQIRRSRFRASDDEIEELAMAFNSMAQALATLESSRRSFVGNVSHELKTPMTTIGGFIDGILDGTIEPEKHKQYLRVVSDEVKRLSRLVTGMLNMNKIEAGELDINPVHFDISEMIFRTLLSFEQLIDKKHIEIRGLEELKPTRIFADTDMINQVVYNLLDNAVKFTPEGGYIQVSSIADSEKAIIKIRNSGKGIPYDEIDKIFERFYKIDKSRSYDIKGAGLGLYLCKTIIDLHGGQILARSVVDEYTEFIFRLPING